MEDARDVHLALGRCFELHGASSVGHRGRGPHDSLLSGTI